MKLKLPWQKQCPITNKLGKVFRKLKKPFKKKDFMLKLFTILMALAFLASSILPYILR